MSDVDVFEVDEVPLAVSALHEVSSDGVDSLSDVFS